MSSCPAAGDGFLPGVYGKVHGSCWRGNFGIGGRAALKAWRLARRGRCFIARLQRDDGSLRIKGVVPLDEGYWPLEAIQDWLSARLRPLGLAGQRATNAGQRSRSTDGQIEVPQEWKRRKAGQEEQNSRTPQLIHQSSVNQIVKMILILNMQWAAGEI